MGAGVGGAFFGGSAFTASPLVILIMTVVSPAEVGGAHRHETDHASLAGDPHSCLFLETPKNRPKLGISPNRAYLAVAEDVLGYMLGQGRVIRDEAGWYRLAGDEAA